MIYWVQEKGDFEYVGKLIRLFEVFMLEERAKL